MNVLPRPRQRLGGLLIAALGTGFTIWTWHRALTTGEVSLRAAMIMPAFAVVGAALMVFPGYREERTARGEDISTLTGWALITRRWKIVLAVALAAGAINCGLLVVG